jgi:hypothetical protein
MFSKLIEVKPGYSDINLFKKLKFLVVPVLMSRVIQLFVISLVIELYDCWSNSRITFSSFIIMSSGCSNKKSILFSLIKPCFRNILRGLLMLDWESVVYPTPDFLGEEKGPPDIFRDTPDFLFLAILKTSAMLLDILLVDLDLSCIYPSPCLKVGDSPL